MVYENGMNGLADERAASDAALPNYRSKVISLVNGQPALHIRNHRLIGP